MARVDDGAVPVAELWRGGLPESTHLGHAVICDSRGIVEAWGNPAAVIFPRSSCKMIQALPLVESGAAAAAGLTPAHLAEWEELWVPAITPSRYLLLVETGDEVLDYRVAVARYAGARQIVVPGGDHSLQSFASHIPALLEFAGMPASA